MKKLIITFISVMLVIVISLFLLGDITIQNENLLSGKISEQELNIKPIGEIDKKFAIGDMLFLVATENKDEESILIKTDSDLKIIESYHLGAHYENIDFSTNNIYIYNDEMNETYNPEQSSIIVEYDSEIGELLTARKVEDIEKEFSTPYISLWTDNTLEIVDEEKYEKLNDPQIMVGEDEYYVVDFTQNVKVKKEAE